MSDKISMRKASQGSLISNNSLLKWDNKNNIQQLVSPHDFQEALTSQKIIKVDSPTKSNIDNDLDISVRSTDLSRACFGFVAKSESDSQLVKYKDLDIGNNFFPVSETLNLDSGYTESPLPEEMGVIIPIVSTPIVRSTNSQSMERNTASKKKNLGLTPLNLKEMLTNQPGSFRKKTNLDSIKELNERPNETAYNSLGKINSNSENTSQRGNVIKSHSSVRKDLPSQGGHGSPTRKLIRADSPASKSEKQFSEDSNKKSKTGGNYS